MNGQCELVAPRDGHAVILKRVLGSVLAQAWPPAEVIGSPDREKIAKS